MSYPTVGQEAVARMHLATENERLRKENEALRAECDALRAGPSDVCLHALAAMSSNCAALSTENEELRRDLAIARELAREMWLNANDEPFWSGGLDLDLFPMDYPWLEDALAPGDAEKFAALRAKYAALSARDEEAQDLALRCMALRSECEALRALLLEGAVIWERDGATATGTWKCDLERWLTWLEDVKAYR